MSANDLQYGACPSCGDDEVAKLGYYWEEDIRYWFVECAECGYRTNDCDDAAQVVDEWNGEEEAEEDEDENPQTIDTLVRMLDETRTAHEELKVSYVDLEDRYAKRKSDSLLMSYGGAIIADAQVPVGKMRDIALYGKDVVPNLEARIKELEAAVKAQQRQLDIANSYKGQLTERSEELRRERDRSFEDKQKLRDWAASLYLIDIALVSLELSRSYPDTIEPLMPLQDLLDAIRDKAWPPKDTTKTFDTILGEIISISSPYGSHPAPGLYLRAIQAHLTTHPTKDAMVSNVYGLAMEKFGQGSRGYTLAWEALGRPGETKHDGRRPRT